MINIAPETPPTNALTGVTVALFGTFDVPNYGDCLFPLIVKNEIEKQFGQVNLYPFSPTSAVPQISDYPKVYSFNEITEVFPQPPTGFIIGGGALLNTEYSLSLWPQIRNILYPNGLKYWLLPIMIGKAWGCPVIFNAVGGSVFSDAFNDIGARYLNKLDLCLVREEFTAKRLRSLNVNNEVAPDCGVVLPELLASDRWDLRYRLLSSSLGLPGRFIVAQASFYIQRYFTAFTNAVADIALKAKLPVVLLPICHHISDNASLKIMRRMLDARGVETHLVTGILKTLDTSAILAKSQIYIGTSLHGTLTSLAFRRPAIAFNPSERSKHRGALRVIDLEICNCSDVSDIPLRAVELMKLPINYFDSRIQVAANKVHDYFSRMGDIIRVKRAPAIPEGWAQDRLTGMIECPGINDFDILNNLCRKKSREINFAKAIILYLIRKHRFTGEFFDMMKFRLRNRV